MDEKMKLIDSELEQVTGGKIEYPWDGAVYRPEDVKFIYKVGERVEVWQTIFYNTARGTIVDRRVWANFERYLADGRMVYRPVYDIKYDGYEGVYRDIKQSCISH